MGGGAEKILQGGLSKRSQKDDLRKGEVIRNANQLFTRESSESVSEGGEWLRS